MFNTRRLILREWRDEDFEPFAAINADPRVMETLGGPISRAESDALAQRAVANLLESGWCLWALELPGTGLIGFTGLAVPGFQAHFTPCVEIGWRLAYEHWGKGYATEAAFTALAVGFGVFALPEIVSFTAETNVRSRRVMERLGMTRDPADDFDHPGLEAGDPLRRHVLYRIKNPRADQGA